METPVRVNVPAMEPYIDPTPCSGGYLRTSPELHMKRCLAAGCGDIYQLGPCFRQGESGRLHREQFVMLEWYRRGAGWRDVLNDTRDLMDYCVAEQLADPVCKIHGRKIDFRSRWRELTVDEAFRLYSTEYTVDDAVDEDVFEHVLVEEVEPHLGAERPTVLHHYPLKLGGFAQTDPERPGRVERWELYVGGIELANGCTEIVSASEQKQRFQHAACVRHSQGRPTYELDEKFMDCLRKERLPACAGVALGFDRLVMILAGANDISEVMPFPDE